MVSNGLRIVGLMAMFVGLLFTLTGMGAIIGIPLILIGAVMFVPELVGLALIIGIIFVILLLIML